MSFAALVEFFANDERLPIPVSEVVAWIRTNTDHKTIDIHPVQRKKEAFRGACRRRAVPVGGPVYGQDTEIITTIIYADDLTEDWKRLVICKEALHVFDGADERVSTPSDVRKLIATMITPEVKASGLFLPAVNDNLGAFKAMAVLIPRTARIKLKAALENGTRTVSEIAAYTVLPDHYVDIWIRFGDELEPMLCGLER